MKTIKKRKERNDLPHFVQKLFVQLSPFVQVLFLKKKKKNKSIKIKIMKKAKTMKKRRKERNDSPHFV
jgi:hypothetical protein